MTMLSANATTAAVQPTLSSSLLGFVGLWLGGFTSHSGQRLPNSWEQLLEWANTISIWRLFRGDASVDHVDRETVYHTLLSSAIYDEKISSPLREQFNLVFLPTVNVDHVDEVDRLPLLSWIDRAIFFHKHVSMCQGVFASKSEICNQKLIFRAWNMEGTIMFGSNVVYTTCNGLLFTGPH